MVKFFIYKWGDEVVVINPAAISHMYSEKDDKGCTITMIDGRRYFIHNSGTKELAQELEKLSSNG